MNKIYIIMGYINESGDEDTWVDEVFTDKEQAEACCEYLNLTKTQDNIEFSWFEMNVNTEDYIEKLSYIKD